MYIFVTNDIQDEEVLKVGGQECLSEMWKEGCKSSLALGPTSPLVVEGAKVQFSSGPKWHFSLQAQSGILLFCPKVALFREVQSDTYI